MDMKVQVNLPEGENCYSIGKLDRVSDLQKVTKKPKTSVQPLNSALISNLKPVVKNKDSYLKSGLKEISEDASSNNPFDVHCSDFLPGELNRQKSCVTGKLEEISTYQGSPFEKPEKKKTSQVQQITPKAKKHVKKNPYEDKSMKNSDGLLINGGSSYEPSRQSSALVSETGRI